MKTTRQLFAILLSVTMIASCLMAVPVFAADEETPFIDYNKILNFQTEVTEQNATAKVITGTLGFTDGYVSHTSGIGFEVADSVLRTYSTTAGRVVNYSFNVDLAQSGVYEYVVECSKGLGYAIHQGTAPDRNSTGFIGATAASWANTSTPLKIGWGTAKTVRYTLVVDGEANTISYYMNGVLTFTSEPYTEESTTLAHYIRSNTTSSSEYCKIYYQANYTPGANPAFQILSASTTGAVVQFNNPVDPTTLTNMKVGETAVGSYTDVSKTYDEVNVYQLTFASAIADNAHYTLSADGVTGLKTADTDVDEDTDPQPGAALSMADQAFTLGTPIEKDPNAMTMYTLHAFDEEAMDTDGALVNNPMGWSVIRNAGNRTWNYDGNGSLLLKAPVQDAASRRTQFEFNIDLTKDVIYDYRIKAPLWGYYAIDMDDDSNGDYIGGTAGGNLSSSSFTLTAGASGSAEARFTIKVDTAEKTVKYYKDGVWYVTEEIADGDTVRAYNHHFVNSDNARRAHDYEIYYYAEYEAAENAKIKVVDVPAANQVVVQFNQPVSLEELTEGFSITDAEGTAAVSAITAVDASHTYECPNTYKLTYENLSVGDYTVAANLAGLSDAAAATDFGTASFTVDAFTAEVKTLGEESYLQANRSLKRSGEEEEVITTVAVTDGEDNEYNVGLVALPEATYGKYAYQINTRTLPNGTYNVTVNPVAVDGITAEAVTYTLTVSGEKITFGTPAVADGVLTVNATNNRTANQTFTLILAEYATDSDGNVSMTQAAVDTMTAKAFAGEKTYTLSLTPSEAADGVTYFYKAFVWDSVSAMNALVD